MRFQSSVIALLLTAGIASAQQTPAIRPLGAVTATSKETFGQAVFVRHGRNGVFVNDVQNRRLLLFDPSLSTFSVVADSTPATANSYSGRTGGLIAYKADSTLFVDAQSMSMLVIDPDGKVARVMSVPRSQDAMVLGNPGLGVPAFDAKDRLVYRPIPRPDMRAAMQSATTSANGTPIFTPPQPPESAAVLAVSLATRQVDTLAFTKIPKVKMDVQRNENGGMMIQAVANPLPTIDDWAVLSDGSIAFVRGQDYHIDWLRPDGRKESTPKIPFEWKRLTDEEKVAFIDSVKAARERMMAANAPAGGGPTETVRVGGGGGAGADGQRQRPTREGGGDMVIIGGGPGGPGGPGAAMMGGGRMPSINMIPPSELPDYQPPFFAGQMRADADGHLWVRTIPTKAIPGGPVYDVINLKGELIDRVQVPMDRTIIGFGAGGVVYLAWRDGTKTTLERASFK